MERWTERTRLLLGDEKLGRLRSAHVLVVGLGGVGAYAAEMIVRAGAKTDPTRMAVSYTHLTLPTTPYV